MTISAPPTMAASWADQPAGPPPASSRKIVTPAARALLRSRDMGLDTPGGYVLPGIVRLAEAQGLARAKSSMQARSAVMNVGSAPHTAAPAANPSALQDAWAGVDVPIPPGQGAADRIASVLSVAATAMRRRATPLMRALIRFPAPEATPGSRSSVVIDDPGSLSVSGIRRRISADERAAGEAHDAQLEIVDGSDLGVTRLIAPAEGRVVVTIGAPARRVILRTHHDGQEVIAMCWVVEVWIHGGGTLNMLETARLAGAIGRALAPVDPV